VATLSYIYLHPCARGPGGEGAGIGRIRSELPGTFYANYANERELFHTKDAKTAKPVRADMYVEINSLKPSKLRPGAASSDHAAPTGLKIRWGLGTTNMSLLTELPADPPQYVKEQTPKAFGAGRHFCPPREDFLMGMRNVIVRHYP
jgi:hypothetical protein